MAGPGDQEARKEALSLDEMVEHMDDLPTFHKDNDRLHAIESWSSTS